MKILLTGADQPLGAAVARELAGAHHLRLTGRGEASDLPAGASYAVADLREPEAVAPLVSGMDAVVHLAAYDLPDEGAFDLLDYAARGTYVLLQQTAEAKVERVICASRLEVVADYPEECLVDETWRPRPEANAAALAPYLAELTCREFARATTLCGIGLRLPALDGEPDGITAADAASAIEGALRFNFGDHYQRHEWRLFHVASRGRFVTRAAQGALDWQPTGAGA